MTTGQKAAEYLRNVAKIVEDKSDAYGDSVGQPLRIFSKADTDQGLRVRIDDKLSRIARGNPEKNNGEDIVKDLIGYLALLAVTETKDTVSVPRAWPVKWRGLARYSKGRTVDVLSWSKDGFVTYKITSKPDADCGAIQTSSETMFKNWYEPVQ